MAKLRRVFEILLVCICVAISSTEIIHKRQHLLDDKRCHFRRLIIFDKFNIGNLEKLISCEKLAAVKKIPSTKIFNFKMHNYNFKIFLFKESFDHVKENSKLITKAYPTYAKWMRYG